MQIYSQEIISLISVYSFMYKDKYSIFKIDLNSQKPLEISANFIFGITTFNEEKVKDFL